ncbi:DUF4145 domain-containing protein [Luteibacter sp. 22Crub2.1]|uniref:DUF4145 domain-containing protein n=1 Tax=Luteibacter sp. 22Crub2.1 TaxID=1283288 RepID=UPI0009C4BBDA|nr:DUF4145 domain-containing protein [Luteibacter sp. 22Crub2.1]SKB50591.1 protein of unknown function [Luteibacter sp. 22Crub2.1]
MNPISKRLADLSDEIDEILRNTIWQHGELMGNREFVNGENYLAWKVKTLNAIQKAAGIGSTHEKHFIEAAKVNYGTNKDAAENQRAVLLATRDDFDSGFMATARTLARAEVFDTELDMARELLQSGYRLPAAVIARTVLEVALRELCAAHEISPGKLDKMNADLAKDQAYSVLVQKKVTVLADIGNRAAHGKSEFNEDDVADMIAGVERFVTDFAS